MAIDIIVEGAILGALLVLFCAVGICGGAVNMVFLYHRDVQDRCLENGLITRKRSNAISGSLKVRAYRSTLHLSSSASMRSMVPVAFGQASGRCSRSFPS